MEQGLRDKSSGLEFWDKASEIELWDKRSEPGFWDEGLGLGFWNEGLRQSCFSLTTTITKTPFSEAF